MRPRLGRYFESRATRHQELGAQVGATGFEALAATEATTTGFAADGEIYRREPKSGLEVVVAKRAINFSKMEVAELVQLRDEIETTLIGKIAVERDEL